MPDQNKNKRLTLNKTDRLKSTKAIQALFLHNQQLKAFPLKVFWVTKPSTQGFNQKVTVAVSKKLFKHAVTRNLIKRRMRECVRLNKQLLDEKLQHQNITLEYMFIYTGAKILPFKDFESKIKQLIMRLGDNINDKLQQNI